MSIERVDSRELFVNYRRTLMRITIFRHLNKSEQDNIIQDIINDTEALINELLLIQQRDKLSTSKGID